MTSHRERAEKFLRSIMTRSPSPDEISHVESAFREVEAQALEKSCKACKELKLIGTTGCDGCEIGRISMYSQGTHCLSCKALKERGRDE